MKKVINFNEIDSYLPDDMISMEILSHSPHLNAYAAIFRRVAEKDEHFIERAKTITDETQQAELARQRGPKIHLLKTLAYVFENIETYKKQDAHVEQTAKETIITIGYGHKEDHLFEYTTTENLWQELMHLSKVLKDDISDAQRSGLGNHKTDPKRELFLLSEFSKVAKQNGPFETVYQLLDSYHNDIEKAMVGLNRIRKTENQFRSLGFVDISSIDVLMEPEGILKKALGKLYPDAKNYIQIIDDFTDVEKKYKGDFPLDALAFSMDASRYYHKLIRNKPERLSKVFGLVDNNGTFELLHYTGKKDFDFNDATTEQVKDLYDTRDIWKVNLKPDYVKNAFNGLFSALGGGDFEKSVILRAIVLTNLDMGGEALNNLMNKSFNVQIKDGQMHVSINKLLAVDSYLETKQIEFKKGSEFLQALSIRDGDNLTIPKKAETMALKILEKIKNVLSEKSQDNPEFKVEMKGNELIVSGIPDFYKKAINELNKVKAKDLFESCLKDEYHGIQLPKQNITINAKGSKIAYGNDVYIRDHYINVLAEAFKIIDPKTTIETSKRDGAVIVSGGQLPSKIDDFKQQRPIILE